MAHSQHVCGFVALLWFFAAPTWAQTPPPAACTVTPSQAEHDCPHPPSWVPSQQDLERMLGRHKQWSKDWSAAGFNGAWAAQNGEGRAKLCNANLKGANLVSAELSGADLNSADLTGAQLVRAVLKGADLSFAFLSGSNLSSANLDHVVLRGADLSKANLLSANLNCSDLHGTTLTAAQLTNANLRNAVLKDANLTDADLSEAKLGNAILHKTKIEGTKLDKADLTGAIYAPAAALPNAYLAGIEGLSTLTFPAGEETGLVQLRDQLQKAGLRELEREATFAIERGRTDHLTKGGVVAAVEGYVRRVGFGWTTGYGLYPGRALGMIVALWALMVPVYFFAIAFKTKLPRESGIYQIWPADTVNASGPDLTLRDSSKVTWLPNDKLCALGYAAYFSLLSTFHIGWRDLNVGSWISRAQPREYALRSLGWVRAVSGIQSLISVYLLALWALTYFGRPFV
jgi:uncharacterized protein YjbI with pentapeptide repeats